MSCANEACMGPSCAIRPSYAPSTTGTETPQLPINQQDAVAVYFRMQMYLQQELDAKIMAMKLEYDRMRFIICSKKRKIIQMG